MMGMSKVIGGVCGCGLHKVLYRNLNFCGINDMLVSLKFCKKLRDYDICRLYFGKKLKWPK